MYAAAPDPYCYPGTTVLKNRRNIRKQKALDRFEAVMVMWRGKKPMPRGRLSVSHFKAIHHHFFQDVYPWAGRFRTVRISKGGSMFCYPEHIAPTIRQLFAELQRENYFTALDSRAFSQKSAHFLAELNAIHPFREGNGRAQLAFLTVLAVRAGHPLHLDRLDTAEFFSAVIASFGGDEAPLAQLISDLTAER